MRVWRASDKDEQQLSPPQSGQVRQAIFVHYHAFAVIEITPGKCARTDRLEQVAEYAGLKLEHDGEVSGLAKYIPCGSSHPPVEAGCDEIDGGQRRETDRTGYVKLPGGRREQCVLVCFEWSCYLALASCSLDST